MPQEIQELDASNRWANRQILAAAVGLSAEQVGRDLGSRVPSVRELSAG